MWHCDMSQQEWDGAETRIVPLTAALAHAEKKQASRGLVKHTTIYSLTLKKIQHNVLKDFMEHYNLTKVTNTSYIV